MSASTPQPAVVSLDDLLEAFEWANAGPDSDTAAYVCRSTGKISLVGGDGGLESFDEDDEESDVDGPGATRDHARHAFVPERRELDLGSDLVFRFIRRHAPDQEEEVLAIFRRSGAYGRFRALLDRTRLTELWYRFEAAETAAALTAWAEGEGFKVAGSTQPPAVATPPPSAPPRPSERSRPSKAVPPWEARLLEPGDAAILQKVADGVFDHRVQPALAEAVLADRSNLVAVALEGDVVVGMATGFAYLHPDKPLQLFVNEVGVAPTHRRRGIARRLVELLLQRGAALGCEEAWAATEEENVAARRLFASVKGKEDRARAVVLTLPLGVSKGVQSGVGGRGSPRRR